GLFNLDSCGESFLRIAACAADLEVLRPESILQCAGQRGLELRQGCVFIRGKKAVVRDDLDFILPEANLAGESRFIFEERARMNSGLDRIASRLFPVVEKTHPSISHIDAEVSFVSDEKYSGSVVDVAVVV